MSYAPGDTFGDVFCLSATTGAATDADSPPTAKLKRGGVTDGAVTVTVAHDTTGEYSFSGTIPGTYAAGDKLAVVVTATVGGITAKKAYPLGVLLQGVNVTKVNGLPATPLTPPIDAIARVVEVEQRTENVIQS